MTVGRVQVPYHEKERNKGFTLGPNQQFLLDLRTLYAQGENNEVILSLHELFHIVEIFCHKYLKPSFSRLHGLMKRGHSSTPQVKLPWPSGVEQKRAPINAEVVQVVQNHELSLARITSAEVAENNGRWNLFTKT
jgi:hypothetical protein